MSEGEGEGMRVVGKGMGKRIYESKAGESR